MSVKLRRIIVILITISSLTATIFSAGNLASAQATTAFTPQTPFPIPDYNATIFFALDGVYTQAALENDTWVFKGLTFSNGVALDSFKVLAQDCNVTIFFSGIFRSYLPAQDSGLLQYNVTGSGVQQFNFGLSSNFAVNPKYRDLMVRFTSTFFTNNTEVVAMGNGWQLADDGTVTVTGVSSGASIFYVDYSRMYTDTALPFYVQHAVTIAAVAFMLAMIAVGVFLKYRFHKTKMEVAR